MTDSIIRDSPPKDFFAAVTSPEYITDPYPFLRQLRAREPAVETESGIWLVSRYADVARALRDPKLSCDFTSLEMPAAYLRARGVDERYPRPLNALDPPDHRRIRAAIAPPFVPNLVERMRPAVARTVDHVLDPIANRAGAIVDVVGEIAYPIPVAVIADMFGIPVADRPLIERWSRAFGEVSDPDNLLTDDQRQSVVEATREAGDYFARLLAGRRRAPGTDLMSQWLAAYHASRPMSISELLVNGLFLLMVGHHNTVSLICNGLHALLANPGELDRLRTDPALMDNAIEELIRYDSPVQTATRFTTTISYNAGGIDIPARRQVILLLGSANRDETAFTDPDRLDISRPTASRHLGLGRGIHACIGGPLARLEAGITLAGLLRRFPDLALSGTVRRHTPCFALRGMTHFPVLLG
jgi:cytochrome P450